MPNNYLTLDEMDSHTQHLGQKTLRLKQCVDWGYNVPPFVAIPATSSIKLYSNHQLQLEVSQQVVDILHTPSYAVRSSALNEDSQNTSLAGQFLTKTNVLPADLPRAIQEVLEQAKEYLNGHLEQFSIIIQSYIVPDVSGVTFTRNPQGSHELVVEFGYCEGEKIVSGAIQPVRLLAYWNQPFVDHLPDALKQTDLINISKELEGKSAFPQDIEWCIKNDKLYILQTRPITTITQNQLNQFHFLDKTLPTDNLFFYEKTEITEMTPRPTPVTLDLLKTLYTKDGPVDQVYQSHNITYTPTDFLRVIGNELYVDKEQEIKSLLPAYTYFVHPEFRPSICLGKGLIRTLKNLFYLSRLNTKHLPNLIDNLKNRLTNPVPLCKDIPSFVERFSETYKTIFEINLLSGFALKRAQTVLKKEPVTLTEVLASSSLFVNENQLVLNPPSDLVGNTLELSDESIFLGLDRTNTSPQTPVANWWKALPEYKQRFYKQTFIDAICLTRYREWGRWLMVKELGTLRTYLKSISSQRTFQDPQAIYFAHFDEILSSSIDEQTCLNRKQSHKAFQTFTSPNLLTSSVVSHPTQLTGVSSGTAKGLLLTKDQLPTYPPSTDIILYTQSLSPDLTTYFGRVKGIISENGGMLSHLAIMAREKGIPVVVGCTLGEDVRLGKIVEMDGGRGTIKT